ncbi:Os03g0441101, partial [Oryza sativa Japonica Group]
APSRPHRCVQPCRVRRRGAGGAPQPRAEPAVLVAAGGGRPDTHRVAGVEAGARRDLLPHPGRLRPRRQEEDEHRRRRRRGHHVRSKSEGSTAVADWLGSPGSASPEKTRMMRAQKHHHHQYRRCMSTRSHASPLQPHLSCITEDP